MLHTLFKLIVAVGVLTLARGTLFGLETDRNTDDPKPNIVVILADDLGFGDVQPNNADSKIPTPSFDRLAKEGVRFTDAHSGSGVCTPTRYGLLCGRYCWRTTLKRGVLGGYSKPLLVPDEQTIAVVLKRAGYHTGCIGKWHLGLGWQSTDQQGNGQSDPAGKKRQIDFSKPITDGPTHHGFDESYIIPASLDMSPYVYIKNDRVTQLADGAIPGSKFPPFYRAGEISPDFKHVDCLGHLVDQAKQFIRKQSETPEPFFLYFAMPAPHKPVIPMDSFIGKTSIGPYGDFVAQVDWAVGEVLNTLDETGVADQTLLIVTSDNGSFMKRFDDPEHADHTDNDSIQGYRAANHRANGPLRGTKADVWEAGHRVPFFCRWPGNVEGGKTCDTTICLTDILATAAETAGAAFDHDAAEDSFSILDLARGAAARPPFQRPMVINHSHHGTFAIRNGKWKLVMGSGSGGRERPLGKPFEQPYQLFDLENDLGETTNVIETNRDIERELIQAFEAIAHGDQ